MPPITRALTLTAILVSSAFPVENPEARSLGADLIRRIASAHPAARSHLEQVATALDNRKLTLAEARNLVAIARDGGLLGAAGVSPSAVPAAAPVDTNALLDQFDTPAAPRLAPTPPATDPVSPVTEEPLPSPLPAQPAAEMPFEPRSLTSNEPVETPVEVDPATVPVEEPAVPQPMATASPALPSDQEGGPEKGLAITAVQRDPDSGAVLVMIGGGTKEGVSNGQRFRIERDGKTRVLALIFRTTEDMAIATILQSTWMPGLEQQEVAAGDTAVLDK